ncbi:coatomer subunit alpha [Sarracenia purpurea var. burkii]
MSSDAGGEASAPEPALLAPPPAEEHVEMADSTEVELDNDFLCPICMQIIKDAFLSACGHSFCYICIVTHLRNKSDCPCCGHYLIANHLFPNFLLNKVHCFVYEFFLDSK